jgi:hypothetical protein
MALSPAKIFGRPTADRIWLGPAQSRALAFLSDPSPGNTKLLLGPRSCGKSIVLDRYLAGLDSTQYFRSRDGWENPSELLDALLESAQISAPATTDDKRRELFRCYLSDQHELGMDLLLVIDGAEQLTSVIWKEFYRLATIVCDDGYAPEILIAGQAHTYDYLKSPMARDWNGREFSVHRVPPLEPLDVCIYVKDRLNSVGLPEAVFSAPSRTLMGKLAGGSFITTNLLCQMSLVLARQRGATFVDEELVQAAYDCLGKGKTQAAARNLPSSKDISDDGEIFVSYEGKLVSRHLLDRRLLMGRGAHNQVQLESPDVSRIHAAIVLKTDGYYIEDLGSVNGLTVNGELRIKRKLIDRDVITIGPFQLTFAAPLLVESESERLPPLRIIEDRDDPWSSTPELG